MIEKHILPYFGDMPMNMVNPSHIIQWQNEMLSKAYQPTYLRMVQNQLNGLFNHASRIYGLIENPCNKVRKIGKSDANKVDYWTKAEYDLFIATVDKDSYYYALFDILFYTGCRIGEVLALTPNDIDLNNNKISISKTYYRINGKDIITEPKTEGSNRVIDIPIFLRDELHLYMKKLYGLEPDDRLFPVTERAVQKYMKRHIVKCGVKDIRVHDLRHSHASDLIHLGVEPFVIKERLGHRDIRMTLNTYGHLYPSRQKQVADMLDLSR